MITFYLLLSSMLLFAFLLISVPFIASNTSYSYRHLSLLGITTCITLIGYSFFGQAPELAAWRTVGEPHYQFLTEYVQLGGIDGMISKIKQRLKKHPNDAEGWALLGKLTVIKQEATSSRGLSAGSSERL